MKLVDTDVLIWNFRGDRLAAQLLDAAPGVGLSSVTYMELVQGMRNKRELQRLRQALHYWQARVLPVTEGISARAVFLVEEFALSHSLQLADALIAATAIDHGEPLVTANDRHYRHIPDLEIELFRPE